MDDNHTIIYNPLEQGADFHITDKWDKTHHFRILSFMVGTGLLSCAIEVIEESDEREAREYELLSDFDTDFEAAELRLKEKIKRELNIKYLTREYGELSIRNNIMKGRFLGEHFEVDGYKLTLEQFVRTFSAFEGFKFTMQFNDITDC